jgi:hypothetical protein
MQLPLTKEKDSIDEMPRLKNNEEEENNKPRECINISTIGAIRNMIYSTFAEVPDKENQTNDSEVILRRTQSFENDEK